MAEPALEYVAARRTLLDALDALSAHRPSLVLIGAQAVYLHTGTQGANVPPMTTDADLALDTDLLADDPEIAATLRAAGFVPGQPGHWENSQGIAVDLMVAPHQSNRQSSSARAARLTPHANSVARIGPGLALALSDNSLQVIAALDSSDSRWHEIRVAGPAALLVAKAIKLDDRLADASRGNSRRVVDKDALDVLRLLQVCPLSQFTEGLSSRDVGAAAQADIARGLQILRDHATERAHDLPALAARASGDDPTVAPSLVVLVRELLTAMSVVSDES
ncbi:GSU2403 family nucleotidyltransferase fold protein [Kribbella sp. NPDC058245]|uniref:GSU2403 family nucleotidyltransferase fold protein n=1 Tax=Kribbella sp. NPDC058245 TaxID=3346399 RepID=UPI0036E6C520